jgi:hypothetical protein
VTPTFYSSTEYRDKQSRITKRNHDRGRYSHLRKLERRVCSRADCGQEFSVVPSNSKKFCGSSCAARVNNIKRGPRREETKRKISGSLRGRSPLVRGKRRKGVTTVPRKELICANQACGRKFQVERWRKVKYCSVACAMRIVGGRPTSPKASRGKSGIRADIDPDIYFYSRWEANIARIFNLKGIKWSFEPETFDIGGQHYTPDFYIPERNLYIEVKNFWNEYSATRDRRFREAYPHLRLKVILKAEYLFLERRYAPHIPDWEYRNR